MSGREPSEARSDSYATTAYELLQLFTQSNTALKHFKVFRGFTADPLHKTKPRANNPNITLRAHWTAADSARGVFGVQALHEDLVRLAVLLRRVYLTIVDIDVDEWYPSVQNLQNYYVDLNLLRFGVGKILIHSQRGKTPKSVFEAQHETSTISA